MQDMMVGQNIIITERCRALRQLGRNALRNKWKNAILAVVLYLICLTLPALIFNELFGMNAASIVTNNGFTYSIDPEFYQQMVNSMPRYSMLSGIWVILISGALELGLTIYFLATFRGHNVVPKDVFLGFERFGKALGLFLFRYLFIFLWTLLFIVPGIIASIRYSQAFFVLADDPNKSIRQCMDESKAMMRGNKWKYFLLSLSFIGWYILASVPGSLLSSITSTLTDSAAVTVVVSMIASLFIAPVYAYLMSSFSGFYEILAGHLIKETEPAPLSAEQIVADVPIEQIEEVIEDIQANDTAAEEIVAEETPVEELPEPLEAKADESALPEPLDEEDEYHD